MDEDDGRAAWLPGMGLVQVRGDFGAVAGRDLDDGCIEPGVGGELRSRRFGDPPHVRAGPVVHQVEFRRLVGVTVDDCQAAAVRRDGDAVVTGLGGDLGSRAAGGGHRVEVALVQALLAGSQPPGFLILRQFGRFRLPLAGGERLDLTATPRRGIEMRPAGAFGLEVDAGLVRQPTQCEAARPVHPGVVVELEERLEFARSGVGGKDPAVFVVEGAAQQSQSAVVGPLRVL